MYFHKGYERTFIGDVGVRAEGMWMYIRKSSHYRGMTGWREWNGRLTPVSQSSHGSDDPDGAISDVFGFAFVERQKHITTDTDDFYIDLVFYNFRMKRFVLFELKTHKLIHQDVGQLDMYVRMYDDLMKGEDDNPTIGVLLCTDTDNTIARYSVLHESQQQFAAKYMAYMPTEEELRREIEQQKRFFMEQHGK